MTKDPLMSGNVVPFARNAAYLHQRALINRKENHPLDALDLIRRALEKEPDNLDYQMDHAEILCEMGCHLESNRLLIQMLSADPLANECLFGLCCNFYGMNDLDSAYRALMLFLHGEADALERPEVSEMLENLTLARELNGKTGRKKKRAAGMAESACAHMREGDLDGAQSRFQRSLKLDGAQQEVRALYALCLSIQEQHARALEEIQKVLAALRPHVKALCIGARIYARAGDSEKAVELVRRASRTQPEFEELRLVINSACELSLHEEALSLSRRALGESPYDRALLHINAAALINLGGESGRAARNWTRIRRIDPEDTVAPFYIEWMKGREPGALVPYMYQVPHPEIMRRLEQLGEVAGQGAEAVAQSYRDSAPFRQLIAWALLGNETPLVKVALSLLFMMKSLDGENALRAFLMEPDADSFSRRSAVLLMHQIGATSPYHTVGEHGFAQVDVEGGGLAQRLPYAYRRVLKRAMRAAASSSVGALTENMVHRWTLFSKQNGAMTKLRNSDAWAAGLMLSCARSDERFLGEMVQIPGLFGASERAAIHCANWIDHITGVKDGEERNEAD